MYTTDKTRRRSTWQAWCVSSALMTGSKPVTVPFRHTPMQSPRCFQSGRKGELLEHPEGIPCCSGSGLPRVCCSPSPECVHFPLRWVYPLYPPALSIVCRLPKPARNSKSLCRRNMCCYCSRCYRRLCTLHVGYCTLSGSRHHVRTVRLYT